jgi:hypothetical protein
MVLALVTMALAPFAVASDMTPSHAMTAKAYQPTAAAHDLQLQANLDTAVMPASAAGAVASAADLSTSTAALASGCPEVHLATIAGARTRDLGIGNLVTARGEPDEPEPLPKAARA